MVKDPNCAYCVEGELLAKFGYPCCEMKTGKLYVFKEQSKRGRVILAHKKHVSELIELTDEERNDYFADVAKVARAIHKVFNPDKVNYGAYGYQTSFTFPHCSKIQRWRRMGQYIRDEQRQDHSYRCRI